VSPGGLGQTGSARYAAASGQVKRVFRS